MAMHESIEGMNSTSFSGFQSLDANFIYCPNQFFDYGLRYSKRSTTRLVSYVLYSTLRWRDEAGNPINQSIAVPYKDLLDKVKISKGSFDEARTQAIALNLIEQVTAPKSKAKHQKAVTGCYAIKWDEEGEYCTTLGEFSGFYAKEGNRTAIPGEFFTVIIPSEPLNVIKVVGAVIRHTIGYESQFGRRQVAALSLSRLQEYTGITNRTRLIEAITRAIEQGYIVRVSSGVSVKDSPNPESATYSIKWHQKAINQTIGIEMVPEERSKIGTSNSVQKGYQNQSKNGTSIGSDLAPVERTKKGTNIKKNSKQTNKQQDGVVVSLLMQEGFVERVAKVIAEENSVDVIKQQIEWLKHRDRDTNPLGVLRQSIVEDWSEPPSLVAMRAKTQQRGISDNTAVMSAISKAEGERAASERVKKKEQRTKLLQQWNGVSKEVQVRVAMELVERTTDPIHKSKIKDYSFSNPPMEFLIELDRHLSNTPQAA